MTPTRPTAYPDSELQVVATIHGEPYTRIRLRRIFEMLQPGADWKAPIAAIIPAVNATVPEMREAVIFFTGSVPSFSMTTCLARHAEGMVTFEIPAWRVTAAGYRSAIGC